MEIGYTYLEKSSCLDLEPSTMIIIVEVKEFVSFLTSTDSSNSEVFIDVKLSLDKPIG